MPYSTPWIRFVWMPVAKFEVDVLFQADKYNYASENDPKALTRGHWEVSRSVQTYNENFRLLHCYVEALENGWNVSLMSIVTRAGARFGHKGIPLQTKNRTKEPHSLHIDFLLANQFSTSRDHNKDRLQNVQLNTYSSFGEESGGQDESSCSQRPRGLNNLHKG